MLEADNSIVPLPSSLLHTLNSLVTLPSLLLFGSPDHAISTYIILWVLRIVTFSLILRTYLGPWMLALLSDHIRVRSISLWSIRGIYFRAGRRTWRIDRISYVWSSVEGHRRLAVKIDGGSLHISKQEKEAKVEQKHKRNLTLADLNPSPLGRYAWKSVSTLTAFLEPYVRPIIRTYFIACLRVGIKWLPKITQAVSFDLHSMVITFAEVPGAKIVIEETSLHSALDLTYVEHVPQVVEAKRRPRPPDRRLGQGMVAWRNRMAESFQRSLDNALGDSRGTGTLSLKIRNVMGTMPRQSSNSSLNIPFLLSPGLINMDLSVKFNPKQGAIDPRGLEFSLKVGDCSAKIDLLKILLDNVLLKKTPTRTSNLQFPPSPPLAYAKKLSPSPPGFQDPPALASPTQSVRTSLFSPASLFSPSSLMSSNTSFFSPNSATGMLSPTSPKSPASPFLQAISASMRPRRRHLIVQPSPKLKDHKDRSAMLILNSIRITIASITLSFLSDLQVGPYRAQIKDIEASLALSDPCTNRLHQEHLGSRKRTDEYDSNAYALTLTLCETTLERDSNHHLMRLARLGRINFEALAFQWPTPFLVPTSFIGNDPNASFFAMRAKLAGLQLSDRINDLQQLLEIIQSIHREDRRGPPNNAASSPSLNGPLPFAIPRIYVALECGPIVARLMYDTDKGEKHRAIELRNNGFSTSLHAQYEHPSAAISRYFPAASSVHALHWNMATCLIVEPILARVRSKHNFIGLGDPHLLASDKDFLDDPPVLSIGVISVCGSAHAVAQIDGGPDSFAVIDVSTLLVELSANLETVCIELWHPISVDAALRLMSLVPPSGSKASNDSTAPLFLHLPTGLTANVTVARFVVFITAPDINPHDTLELSRGFALRTAVSFEYSSLRGDQEHWFKNLQRSQKRSRLSLPAEALSDAVGASKTFGPPGDKSAFIKSRLHKFLFRAAVATQYEPDEPGIVGREDVSNGSQDIVQIDTIQADICLSSKQMTAQAQNIDTCEISLQIPLIRIYFELVHAYSVLLGLQTVSILSPPRPPRSSVSSERLDHSPIILFHGNVTAIQALVTLPTKKLVLRIDGLSGHLASGVSPRFKWSKTTVFVKLPSWTNGWDVPSANKWDEFITLQAWEISFTTLAGSLCVSIDGDGGRLRIPHGFILADLIQDASVAAKAVKHIVHMAGTGCYSDMPNPEPEGPKSVPHLTIRLGCLCVEAQDDPFEAKLGLIWQTAPDAIKQRIDREEAFSAKVAAILAEEREMSTLADIPQTDTEHEYQFNSKHSVSIEDARRRLDDVHALDWSLRLEQARDQRDKAENFVLHKLYGTFVPSTFDALSEIMVLPQPLSDAPLFRATLENLCLTISPPSFSIDQLPEVMHTLGSGLPRDTQFSLLVPLHIHFTLSSMTANLRNYPIPLLHIPEQAEPSQISWTFDTDLIVAEEMGTDMSVDWISCPIIESHHSIHGETPFSILVPKTIMPVKTYATPIIKIATPEATTFSWGVSYGPAMQDVMRILDTLSSSPRDPSPTLGSWDKMRLVFHWMAKVSFCGDVRLYMKGTRDPYNILDAGAGFVLCWQGNPEIRIGYDNPQKELIQVISEGMLIAVPDLDGYAPKTRSSSGKATVPAPKPFRKVCARLSSGVRYGIGFTLERSCGPECIFCTGTAFERKCRYFSFRPHYEVKLELKNAPPALKSESDSYNKFRSDFVHLSLSLASSTKTKDRASAIQPSNLHLTPEVFAHFWSWCSLFDGALTLPIRQGNYHPTRPISPKLGRHLATLKYRISLPNLYFMHGYIDDARETWVDGVTPWVGLKGKVDELQVDMHQREEESTTPGPIPGTTRIVRHKPFYAAEVIMKGLELRAILATFQEPLKQNVEMTAPRQRSNYRKHTNLPTTPPTSIWYDLEDFVELDRPVLNQPKLHLLPLAICPHFTYFKRNETPSGPRNASKFGSEHSHICLLGKEPSIPKTQMNLASARAEELKAILANENAPEAKKVTLDRKALMKMVTLLEDYVSVLKEVEIRPDAVPNRDATQNYYMPSDIVSSDEWADFDNVYQIHCPSIFMDSAIRDIMIQYYYCSRDIRGLEYHMAARAVKFIRDQANAALSSHANDAEEESTKDRGPSNAAQMAASALRKVLRGDNSSKLPIDIIQETESRAPSKTEPLSGWADGVSLQRSHCCILLKPQIILSGEASEDECIVAAAQAKLESFAIMDLANLEDPISGKIMSRNYTSLSGLQAFAPTKARSTQSAPVPLEVLIDLRCESDAFERLVPQTEAIFHYDKFNRLRLRNKTTSIAAKFSVTQNISSVRDSHLQDQTDLIRLHIPRFTVSANAEHFQAISNIVTKLLLFSDPAHKSRLDKLETLIFKYDFTDLGSAACVVSSLQSRLRDALETECLTRRNWRRLEEDGGRIALLNLQAHIFLLSEELNLLFDSIKMAQDRFDDQADQKSALLLHASSTEISWRMLDERRNLLSKLVVTDINFRWLSRQDSSTVNHLTIGNLSAFDGSRYALWTEILSKYDDPPNHPLLKRGLFLLANWTILAPVGGITIYEAFELSLHPLRLQIDAKVGRRIMEYVWPGRAHRTVAEESEKTQDITPPEIVVKSPVSAGRSSFDSPRGLQASKSGDKTIPPLRRLGSSRSFTDLKSARETTAPPSNFLTPQGFLSPTGFLKRTHSSDSINFFNSLDPASGQGADADSSTLNKNDSGDAQVMKIRSSQKSFVLVRISSLHVLLSVVKEGSFECHDAKIKTRELEYRNQTWSFEELVNQFIPSNMSWRGWVKMAFHQPLVPVLPVARELLAKTKWTASSKVQPHDSPLRLLHPSRMLVTDDDQRLNWTLNERKSEISAKSSWRQVLRSNKDSPKLTSLPLTDEPEAMDTDQPSGANERRTGRKRVKSLFSKRNSSKSKGPEKRQSEDILKAKP